MSLGDRHRQERMWQRFQKVGIVVDDDQPQSNDGIQIFRDDALLSCRVIIHGLGWVYYVLSLRLISDSPNRVIEAFIIETDSEPIYVERGQKVPPRYVEWAPEADILNDRIGRGFGPTLCKKGLLLGQGAYSPVPNRKQRWTSITVRVMDQFEQWYAQALPVEVQDYSVKNKKSMVPKVQRKSVFEAEEDEPAVVQLSGGLSDGRCAPQLGIGTGKAPSAGERNRK